MGELPTRVLRAAVPLAAGSLLLAACGAGGVGGGEGQEGAELTTGVEDFMRERGGDLEDSSISILAQTSPQADAIRAISDQFTDLTGIEVNWTVLDEQSTENKAAVALGSGDGGYDIIQTPSGLVPTYSDRGWIVSIDDLAADEDSLIPGWNADAYGEGTTGLLSRDGVLYGVPMFIGTQVFYYRTDVFEAADIDAPPTTYRELTDIVAKINSEDVAGIAIRTAPSPSQLLFTWSAWLYAYGGRYYEDYADGVYSGSALDSPEAVEALTTFVDLVQNYAPSGATNWSVDDVTRAFMAGRVGIVQEGAVFGGSFNDPETSQAAGNVDTFVLPAGDAGSFVPYNAHGWSIAANSDAVDAAWLFTQWATLAETLTSATQSDANFSTPPLAGVYSSPEFEERYGFGDYVATVTETIETADSGGVSPLEGDPNYLPATADWATVGQQIAEELSKAVTGQVSVEDALSTAGTYLE